MTKVKWGVLGTANIAGWGTIPGMKLAQYCDMYAIAGRNPEKAKLFAGKFGFQKAYGSYDELLSDKEEQKKMSAAIKSVGRADAAILMTETVLGLVGN